MTNLSPPNTAIASVFLASTFISCNEPYPGVRSSIKANKIKSLSQIKAMPWLPSTLDLKIKF